MQQTSRIHTLFYWCNDISSMRRFYSDLIGWRETYFRNDEKFGWLTYEVADVNVVFTRASTPLPICLEWAKQPGYAGGSLEIPSLVIAALPGEFTTIVERLKAAEVPLYQDEPILLESRDRQFFVKDPMGATVEIYTKA